MSRSILSFAVLAAVAVLSSATVSDNVKNSLHGSRGGDIVITHASPLKGDAVVIALDHQSKKSSLEISSEMSETEFASLVSHVIGGFSMSAEIPKQSNAFPSSSLFSKPRANLVLAVPSLGEVSAAQFSMSNIQKMRQELPSFSLEASFEPRHPLSQLTTLMTGVLPSSHGISSPVWATPANQVAAAYSTPGSHAAAPTVGDVLLRTFDNAAVVSFSASPAFASAGAAHVRSGFERSYIISMDQNTISNSGMGAGFTAAAVDIPAFLAKSNSLLALFTQQGGVVSFNEAANTVTVQVSSTADAVEFNLNNESDRLFFAELASLDELIAQLSSGDLSQLVSDASPDLYTVALVGLQGLMQSYEITDPKTMAAAQLLDAIVPELVKKFQSLYQNQLSAEIVLMGSPSMDAVARKAIIESIQHRLHSKVDAQESYPSLYVQHIVKSKQLDSLCNTAQKTASKYGLKAECVSQLTRPALLQEKSQIYSKQSSTTTTTQQNVVDFQINLWVSVLLVVILLGALYPLLYIDVTAGVFSSFLFAKKYV